MSEKSGQYDYMSFTHELDWIAQDANGKLEFHGFSPRGLKKKPLPLYNQREGKQATWAN
jgi:hypothetical protein